MQLWSGQNRSTGARHQCLQTCAHVSPRAARRPTLLSRAAISPAPAAQAHPPLAPFHPATASQVSGGGSDSTAAHVVEQAGCVPTAAAPAPHLEHIPHVPQHLLAPRQQALALALLRTAPDALLAGSPQRDGSPPGGTRRGGTRARRRHKRKCACPAQTRGRRREDDSDAPPHRLLEPRRTNWGLAGPKQPSSGVAAA